MVKINYGHVKKSRYTVYNNNNLLKVFFVKMNDLNLQLEPANPNSSMLPCLRALSRCLVGASPPLVSVSCLGALPPLVSVSCLGALPPLVSVPCLSTPLVSVLASVPTLRAVVSAPIPRPPQPVSSVSLHLVLDITYPWRRLQPPSPSPSCTIHSSTSAAHALPKSTLFA